MIHIIDPRVSNPTPNLTPGWSDRDPTAARYLSDRNMFSSILVVIRNPSGTYKVIKSIYSKPGINIRKATLTKLVAKIVTMDDPRKALRAIL